MTQARVGTPVVLPADAGRRVLALVEGARPRQWVKNVLVLAAPVAAGELARPAVLGGALLAFVTFTAASAAVYLANDVLDADRDRLHPVKMARPVASGRLRPPVAVTAAVVLAATAVVVPVVLGRPGLAAVLAVYLVISAVYALGLKHVVGVEIAVVASGFVLRTLGGAAGAGIAVSAWFLVVCAAGALAVATGKRFAELRRLGDLAQLTRPVLGHYRADVLRRVRGAAAGLTLVAYLGWCVTRSTGLHVAVTSVSAVPLAVALVVYVRVNDRGHGEAPEELLRTHRGLQVAGLAWLVLFAAGAWVG